MAKALVPISAGQRPNLLPPKAMPIGQTSMLLPSRRSSIWPSRLRAMPTPPWQRLRQSLTGCRASQLKNAAASLTKATEDKATADAALDAAEMAVNDAEYDLVEADDAVTDAAAARDASAAAVARLRGINLAEAIANGSADDADEAFNAKIAAAHDAATAATNAVAPAYLEALANYTAAKAEFDQARPGSTRLLSSSTPRSLAKRPPSAGMASRPSPPRK